MKFCTRVVKHCDIISNWLRNADEKKFPAALSRAFWDWIFWLGTSPNDFADGKMTGFGWPIIFAIPDGLATW